jgi:hypothetical protein
MFITRDSIIFVFFNGFARFMRILRDFSIPIVASRSNLLVATYSCNEKSTSLCFFEK